MPASLIEIRRANLEKRLAALIEEYTVASDELIGKLGAVDRLRIERQIAQLEREIEAAESDLRQLELSGAQHDLQSDLPPEGDDQEIRTVSLTRDNLNQVERHLNEHLPYMDFRRPSGIFRDVIEGFGHNGGSAIFLLQNANVMGGEWFVRRMRNFLNSPEKTMDFRTYELQFSARERLDSFNFLSHLGRRIGIAPSSDDLDLYAATLIETIVRPLRSASIVCIELGVWQNLCIEEQFLDWFVNSFWIQLTNTLSAIAGQLPMIKLVAIIVAYNHVSPKCFQSLRSGSGQFDCTKILELPLRKWTKDDIHEWLYKYVTLAGSDIRLTATHIAPTANSIYNLSDRGTPTSVYNALRKCFEELYAGRADHEIHA